MAAHYDDMIGAPFKIGGRSLERGIDCLGVLLEYFRRNGRDIPDPFPELAFTEGLRSVGLARAAFGSLWAPADGTRVGDVAVLEPVTDNDPLHVAILVEPGWLLQAMKMVGVVRTRVAPYRPRIVAWHRLAAEVTA